MSVANAPVIDAKTRAAINAVSWFERSHKSFRHFARMFWPEAVPSAPIPIWSWYLDAICDEVQQAFDESDRRRELAAQIRLECRTARQAERRTEAELGHLPRLWVVVEVGPRLGKSSLIQRLLPAWLWGRDPRCQMLSLAGTDRIVERDGIYLRELIGSHKYARYLDYLHDRAMAVGVRAQSHRWALRQDQNAKSKFDTSLGGTRQGYSITSKFTGADSDVTLIDDPYDVEEVLKGTPERIAQRMADVVQTFRDKVQDRRNNPIWHVTVLIMQRLHEEDLAGWMIDQGATSICLPSLYDPEHPRAYRDDPRAPGESISPLRLPRGLLVAMEAESPWMFGCKHGQNPRPKKAGIFHADLWGTYEGHPLAIFPAARRIHGTLDCADKPGAQHARSVFRVWGEFLTPRGLKYRLLDEWPGRVELPELEEAFGLMVGKWPTMDTVYIEDAANGRALIQRTQRAGFSCAIVAVLPRGDRDYPGGDKETRAQFTLTALQAGMCELPEARTFRVSNEQGQPMGEGDSQGLDWAKLTRDEYEGFPRGTFKDRVDADSQLMIRWQVQAASTGGSVREQFGALYAL